MRRSVCLGCFGVLGVLLLIVGAIVVGLFDPVVDSFVYKELVLKKDSDIYEKWRLPPVVPHLLIYFFNVSNKEEFQLGDKPVLQEVGPYCYREHWEKVNITFHDNGTVSYETQKHYYFERSKSVGSEDDIITTLNIPMMTAVSKWRFAARLAKLALSSMLEVLKEKPFVTRSVKDLMWGYEDPLLKIAKDILPPGQRLPYDRFGFFVERNGSTDGLLNVFTGEDGDMSRYTLIDTFNHQHKLNYWLDDSCNALVGTDGSSFPPGISEKDRLYMFNDNLCRSLPLTYKHDVDDFGVNGMRFSPPPDAFGNASVNPENLCFCVGGPPCAGTGLFNISSCKFGSPTIVSWPHFYQADPKYLNAVEGLSPNADKHGFYIDIAPRSGAPLRAQARLQINIAVPYVPEVKVMSRLREIIFPVLWFSDGVTELPEDLLELLQFSENVPPVVKSSLELAFFVLGGVFVLVVCVAMLAGHFDLPVPYLNPSYTHKEGKVTRTEQNGIEQHVPPPKPGLMGHTNTLVSDQPENDRA
ncbi:hypothetical protein Pcinc_036012 [Petrolisthes cinctipes]|uniref:Scavenger receptor class B member 1 n=1 Tax=Petrolisthes cinctipes TaxID=88211 RepID=A0AAE1BVC7_PETCI|nr:hypothetical protein Pcinc_036012 [Petrolisthes cinctipes]